jgi:AraC-like DNA-binding protein
LDSGGEWEVLNADDMDASELLTSHRLVRTSDIRQGETLLEKYLPRVPVRLRVAESTTDFVLGINTVNLGEVTVSYLYSTVDVHVVHHPTRNYHANVPIRGVSRWRGEDRAMVDSNLNTAAVLNPGASGEVLWGAGCAQLCVLMPPSAIERELQRHLGRVATAPLRFQHEMPLCSTTVAGWLDALGLVCRTVDREGRTELPPMLTAMLQDLLIDSLLLTQKHNYSDQLRNTTRDGSSAAVRRAAELLHDRPEHPWSVGQLAEHVHLSVRALQQAFRRDLGDSPMRYLRRIRLAKVHATLLADDPNELTVTEVANRWGFGHHGHFAAAYRAQFSESPSQTLNNRAAPPKSDNPKGT